MTETIKFIVGTVLIFIGLVFTTFSFIGVLKLKTALKRIHAASINDTMGVFFILMGLVVYSGFSFLSLKLILLIILFWLVSPVSGHVMSRMIVATSDKEE